MKIILVALSIITVLEAIRVPTVWPERPTKNQQFLAPFKYSKGHHNTPPSFNRFLTKPNVGRYRKTFPKKYNVPKLFKHSSKRITPSSNEWEPISPYRNLGFTTPKPNRTFYDLRQFPLEYYKRLSNYTINNNTPTHENHRGDRSFETEEESMKYSSPEVIDVNHEEEDFKSEHEEPLKIPTSPIYPGEGEWAKKGRKHKPFINQHKIFKHEDSEEKPVGFEIFENGEQLFNKKRAKFENLPKQRENIEETSRESEEMESKESQENDDEKSEFVPMTLYTQVRRSENEEHLPHNSDDSEGGRLKEVIKDSKILTVYTEEGYEDSAYDHAGHEKEAEDSQGYKDFIAENEKYSKPINDQHEDGSTKIKTYLEPETSESKTKNKTKQQKNKNNFLKTKETKTKSFGETPDGRQVEITNEFKEMVGPNNGTKTERIVEIKPTVLKYLDEPPTTPLYNLLEVVFPTQNSSEIHNLSETAQPYLTTEKPTAKEQHRKKRYANDYPELNVEKDFIYDIHESDVPKYEQEINEDKYPYYNSRHINPDSPLRYSESLKRIPEKIEGQMSFYENSNKLMECPEVDEDIEAIPEHLKHVEDSINNGEKIENNNRSPRLGKLGQRIDCFKKKYFGENPLDSPIFQEEVIKPVAPLFAGFHTYNKDNKIGKTRNRKYHSKFSLEKIKNHPTENYENNNNYEDEELSSSREYPRKKIYERQPFMKHEAVEIITVDNFGSINEIQTESPRLNLQTTPKYQVDITPKHIYDQIDLLEHLSEYTLTTTSRPHRKAKYIEKDSGGSTESSPLILRHPSYQKFAPRRRQRINYQRPQTQQNYDMNTYLPEAVNSNSFENNHHKVPLEQLNVFSDVLNNIKNGTNDPFKVAASSYQRPNQYTSNSFQNYKNQARIKVPPKKVRIKNPDSSRIDDRDLYHHLTSTPSSTTTTTSTTKKPRRGVVRYASTTERDYDYDYNEAGYGKKSIPTRQKFITPTPAPSLEEQDEENMDSDISETHQITTEAQTYYKPVEKSTTEIHGLVPPSKWQYKTIYLPDEESEPEISESENINQFYVAGMKPPSNKPQHFNYHSQKPPQRGKGGNRFKRLQLRRGKRSPNRRSYFEVVRNDEKSRTEDDDDDYVPHRPKNWHWDEKLKKIIYDKPKTEEKDDYDDDDDVEVVEIEVKDPVPTNIQRTTPRRKFTTTTPRNGPSYVDYIKSLKNNENYVSIPDPTTTKDGIKPVETITEPSTTSAPTKPPEFLSFVSQLRKSDSYKSIEEKNKTKSTTTTTEVPEEEEDVEDSEPALSNVQNSPGRGAVDVGNFKMFNVNDFLPNVKTYSPRTSIDYSKYKTIQRAHPRTTSTTPEAITSGFPIKHGEISHSTDGKVEIIELSRGRIVTTSSTTTTTSRPQRLRGRRPSTSPRTTPITVSTEGTFVITAEKPKRVYPRRRPVHIRSRTNVSEEHKIVRRRHNIDERHPKVISLETIIDQDDTNKTKSTSSLDTILKNINQLKEINVEVSAPGFNSETKEDDLEELISQDDREENPEQKMYYYSSVR